MLTYQVTDLGHGRVHVPKHLSNRPFRRLREAMTIRREGGSQFVVTQVLQGASLTWARACIREQRQSTAAEVKSSATP